MLRFVWDNSLILMVLREFHEYDMHVVFFSKVSLPSLICEIFQRLAEYLNTSLP